MRESIDQQNTEYAQQCAMVRRLVAEQRERNSQLAKLSNADRFAYARQAGENVAVFLAPEPRPLCLDDLRFTALFLGSCMGEIIPLEQLCESLFINADLLVENGDYTYESIDSIYRAYAATRN